MSLEWKDVARFAGGPIVELVIDGVEVSSKYMKDASKGNLQALREEALKQEIQMEFSKHQARVAQEIAIAKRIENAVEVEIEEYYDNVGKKDGGLNINAEARTLGIGLSSETNRVSKRIYKFRGNSQQQEYIQSEYTDKK